MEVRGEGVRGADEPKYGDEEEKESKWKVSIEMRLQAFGTMRVKGKCVRGRELGMKDTTYEKERQ